MNAETALITGATSGIGLHLAKEFARQGHSLVLVARVESELAKIAKELQDRHGVSARFIARDVEKSEAAQQIFNQITGEGIKIDILVNNAGFAHRGKFWDISIEDDISILRLNIEAVLRLTKLFLSPMIERGCGRLLNLASVAAFEPGPLLALYHATKAFVLSFTEALATELKGTGVTATALCPGPTDTDFFPKAGMVGARMFQQANLMAPQDVAKAGYDGMKNGDRVVVPGAANKLMVFSRRILPEAMLAKMTMQLYEDVGPAKQKRKRGDRERQYAGNDGDIHRV